MGLSKAPKKIQSNKAHTVMKMPFSIFIVMLVIYFTTVDSKSVLKANKLRHNRNQALEERFPDSVTKLLKKLQNSLKRSQASLQQIICREKRAQHYNNKGVPFSSWAG